MKNALDNYINGIIATAQQTLSQSPDDYVQEGLLFCGTCHCPKQIRLNFGRGEVTVPCLCKCGEAALIAEEAEKKQRREMEAIESLKAQSLMDAKFSRQTFDAWQVTDENEKAYRICRRYVERWDSMLENNQGLLLYGSVGTGKTYAAACIANALLDRRVPVVMTSFVKLLDGYDDELTRRLNRARLLIVDDLGAERGTDYALEKVYAIIDGRYRAGLPMILTTNLELGDMQKTADIRYGRIYDRIFETCYPVRFAGLSRRKTEAKRRFDAMKALMED